MHPILPEELNDIRQRLRKMRRRLTGSVGGLSDEALSPSAPVGGGQTGDAAGDTGDLSVQDDATDLALSLFQNERQILSQVNAALQRLDDGTFGSCIACGRPIDRARLRAVPYTAYCLDDANRLEREVGGPPPVTVPGVT